jgi:hypothetical protein
MQSNKIQKWLNAPTKEIIDEHKFQHEEDADSLPNTHKQHANFVLDSLIDYCHENDLAYDIPTTEGTNTKGLVDSDIKEAFYKFCYDNTTKKA